LQKSKSKEKLQRPNAELLVEYFRIYSHAWNWP